ncbi:MAG: aminoacyl-tRNA hydrolase [Patescibacteria group bacterium]|nr:aminoacyl-tRNA hydrolase [Patescibacteria group bacterium]
MKLIIGLGNPGKEYEKTRHNAGFWVLDNLAESLNADWNNSKSHKAQIAKATISDAKLILAKPQTFMNLSGESVLSIAQFYKIPADNILIVHDELDLEPGCFTFTNGGSAAGHNGVGSVYELTGKKFPRLRIGIGRPPKPGPAPKQWVLEKPSSDDQKLIKKVIKDSNSAITDWVNKGTAEAMNSWNSRKKASNTK